MYDLAIIGAGPGGYVADFSGQTWRKVLGFIGAKTSAAYASTGDAYRPRLI